MEDVVVEVLRDVDGGLACRSAGDALGDGLFGVRLVGLVEGLDVARQREVAVDVWILAVEVGLVEVVRVLHVRASYRVEHDWRVWADPQRDGTGAAGGSGGALVVDRNVSAHDNGVTAIPCGRLDPVQRVEKSVGAPVARVERVDTLGVGVAGEQLRQHRLDGLGLVQQRLRADLDPADRVRVDLVLLQQVGEHSQGHRVDVLSVVDKRHVGLAQSDGVLTCGNTVELLELTLVHTLARLIVSICS